MNLGRLRSVPGGRSIRPFLLALLLAAHLAFPVPVRAADARWSDPRASAAWGSGVTFSQVVTLGRPATRVELLVRSPRDPGAASVVDLGPAASGRRSFDHTVIGSDGGLLPNTRLVGRWRITWEDGSTELGPSAAATYLDTRFDWRTIRGGTVVVHWYAGGDPFGERALAIAERSLASSASLLGVREREPVDFYIYAEQAAFYDALGPGTRENVGGQAVPELRTLYALITPSEIDADWVGIVIPHELAHLVFDTAVANPYHYPPSWLNEGLAVYLAQGYDGTDRRDVATAVDDGTLMPLTALSGRFPTTRERFSLAYAESVSAIDYLVRTHGTDALVALVRSYSRGVSDDETFRDALGVDVTAFEAGWLADLGAQIPTRSGPCPARPGPLPSGWTAPSPATEVASGVPATCATADRSGAPSATGSPPDPGSLLRIWAGGTLVFVILAATAALARRRRSGTVR